VRLHRALVFLAMIFAAAVAHATIFANVRGIVHDPSHRPVAAAKVVLRSTQSDWTRETTTNDQGEFSLDAVPAGEYTLRVESAGFASLARTITVASGSAPILHLALDIAGGTEKVEVTASSEDAAQQSATSQSEVTRTQMLATPGAERTNSLAAITDYVPGAYMVHDQLHVRGGHQVSWLVDGVPVPNTNIASNVGPQFDPRDIETIEETRGGYSAEFGDRTYGAFNVITRSGFERNREAELSMTAGNFGSTDDSLSFGDHTNRFAYYASVNGNRSDYGLETPTTSVLHDAEDGAGGFTSLIYNVTPKDQLRLVASLRRDNFEVPNDDVAEAAGVRDLQRERDAFVNFSWVHTVSSGTMIVISPFYHFNRALYDGSTADSPTEATDHRTSQYAGGQASISEVRGRHNARAGAYGFAQQDDEFFRLVATDGSGTAASQSTRPGGNLEAIFAEDQFHAANWLMLTGGMRLTHSGGGVSENAASPRAGVAVTLPKLHWVVSGFYGRYYQAPPLTTVSGPLEQLAVDQGFGFLPLRGERDEQYQVALTIPVRGWSAELDAFRTNARNFFDHDALGNSNLFLPLTISSARIYGWESTLHSPRIGKWQAFLTYSHQFAQGRGGVTGGLTDFSPPADEFFFLDHDQRDTLNLGASGELPWRVRVSGSVEYGSGFLDGDGPGHLSAHAVVNLSAEKAIGERLALGVTALNIGDHRFLLDNSNTFGGTHFGDPRQVYATLRWRFHY
jgi:outer membrane receptor for ferrienterochelin and colicin